MAGITSPLDSMYQTFLGQTTEAMNQQPSPWQQELMESVNPDKVRRQNIMKALAQASQTLATTPGDFLTGLSAAASSGANSYLTAKSDAESNRLKAMQIAQQANQQAQDRRLQLLYNAIGVNRDIKSDAAKADETTYQHGRDKVADERQARLDAQAGRESDARTAYYNRRGSGITADGADAATERRRGQAANTFYSQVAKWEAANATEMPQEQKDALWSDIMRRFNVSDSATPQSTPRTIAPGKSDQVVNKSATASPVPGSKRGKPLPADLMQQARDAISRGANAQAVRQRLIDNGYDVTGL